MRWDGATDATRGHSDYAAAKARLIRSLRGTVLEIGAGDGRNAGSMPVGITWVGLEPDRRRSARLARLVRARGQDFSALRASADRIPLPDGSVDHVLSVVTLCSVPDQADALAEVRRVLRPGGRLVFAEHVGAPTGTFRRRLQRWFKPLSKTFDHGCDPTRDTETALRRSGLTIDEVERFELPALPGLTMPYIVGVAIR